LQVNTLDMEQWRKNLYVLWLGCFVASMSFSIVTPFMPLFLQQDLNVHTGVETWSGLMFSAGFFTSAMMSPVWGSLADRYGRKIMIIRSGFGIGSIFILQSFVTSPQQLVVLRAMNGVLSGFIPASTALIATNCPEDKMGRCLGILQTASASGHIMGPLFGGIMAQFLGNRQTFVAAGILTYLATTIAIMGVREIARPKSLGRVSIKNDLKLAFSNPVLRLILLACVFIQASLTILQPVLSLQIARLGHADTASLSAGIVYSLVGVATVIGAPLWAQRGDKIGFKRVLVLGLLGAALFNVPMAFVRNIFAFGGLRFATGLSLAGISLALNAVTAKSVNAEFRGRAFGIFNSFSQLGGGLGPILGGVTATACGIESTFLLTALILALCAAGSSRLLPHVSPTPSRD